MELPLLERAVTRPGGITGSPPTLGAIANPDLWPIWLGCALVAGLFTFLLIPVWLRSRPASSSRGRWTGSRPTGSDA